MNQARADVAYTVIKNDIDAGKISAGYQLIENELCQKLNMSRTPIREALNRLHAEGYLEYQPGKGFSTTVYNSEKLRKIYEMIEAVEGMLAYLLAQEYKTLNFSETERAVLEMEESIASENWDKWVQADTKFHDSLYALCNNEYIKNDLEQLYRPAFKVRTLITRVYLDKVESTRSHRAMYEAIIVGDAERARKEAHNHFSWIREQVCKCLETYDIL